MRHTLRALATISGLCIVLGLCIWVNNLAFGAGSHVQNRFDEMSTSVAGATATHLFGFDITDTSQNLGSIEFQFCSNDPLPTLPCTAPNGMDASGAVLANQTNNTGFSIFSATGNVIILTRAPSIPVTGANTYQFNNIVNPTTSDTFYVRLYIFPTTDASGVDTQDGGIAAAINSELTVSGEVPPYLKFCASTIVTNFDCSTATSFLVDLGNLSTKQTASGSSQFVVATNAQFGYNVTLSGNTLTSGNDVIPALGAPTSSQTGSSQFGLNLRANSNPTIGSDPIGPGVATIDPNYNIPDEFDYVNGDELVSTPSSSDNQKFTVSLIANVNGNQAPGVYSTTITYICLANF